MPSKILLIPFLLLLGLTIYLTVDYGDEYAPYIILPAVICVAIFIMGPQIDWFWFERYPPKLDPLEKKLLDKKVAIYPRLSLEQKKTFRSRVALFNYSKSYQEMAMPKVPEDVKIMMAISAAQLTIGLDDFLLENYEKVIVYPHKFPSPQYPDNWHISETFEEDGVMMFVAQNLMHGFINPSSYFNCALYELAKVVCKEQQLPELKSLEKVSIDELAAINNSNEEDLKEYIGLPELDSRALAMVQFIEFPTRLKSKHPDLFEEIRSVLNYNKEWLT